MTWNRKILDKEYLKNRLMKWMAATRLQDFVGTGTLGKEQIFYPKARRERKGGLLV